MVKRANEKGIKRIICIGTDPEDSLAAAEFAKKHQDVYWTYGVHPEETTKEFRLGTFRSAAARDLAPAARGDGPAGRGPE